MNNIAKVAALTIVCLLSSNALAAVSTSSYTLYPSDRDLDDLDHYWHYTWGMNTPWDTTPDENNQYELVTSATLSFNDIRNWDNNPNVLYIHLLDHAGLGVSEGYDHQGYGDHFAGAGPELVTYVNLPSYSQDLSYSLTQDELNILNDYASDGRFGLGFDPDCHFYNRGIRFDVCTETVTSPVVPEPATLAMLLVGGAAVIRRRRKKTL